MELHYSNENQSTRICEKDGVVWISFPLLEREGIVCGFTTRLGGVSEGDCSSMNLSFARGDREEDVRENYRIMGEALGIPLSQAVLSHQVHKTNLYTVKKEDAGKRIDAYISSVDNEISRTAAQRLIDEQAITILKTRIARQKNREY